MKISFGKYKGTEIEVIAEMDIKYLTWCLEKATQPGGTLDVTDEKWGAKNLAVVNEIRKVMKDRVVNKQQEVPPSNQVVEDNVIQDGGLDEIKLTIFQKLEEIRNLVDGI